MVGGELFIAGAIGVLGHKVRIEREGDEKLAKEDYEHMPLRSVMSMLVHCTYFRDLNILTTAGAWVMDYTNDRAKKYGKEHWEPYRCHATESVLKELGLAFFLRKPSHCNPVAPDLAIVLRGTIPTLIWDILADLKIAVETLNKSARVLDTVEIILEVVKDFRNQNPNGKICIAGHSLGAAIALIVGGLLHSAHDIKIDTHLFNPPLMTVVDVINGKAIPKPKAPENVEGDDLVPALEVKFSQLKDLISPQAVLSGLFTPNAKYFNDAVPSADVYVSTWKQEKRRLAHSLRQWHKYTPEHIKLEFRRARLLCHSRR